MIAPNREDRQVQDNRISVSDVEQVDDLRNLVPISDFMHCILFEINILYVNFDR
jgi:hypothetical protein